MFPPNFAPDKLELLTSGMIESLQIAIIATVVGVLLSLPLGLMAARNLAPLPLAWAARGLIALFRTFHPRHRRHPVRQGGRLRRAGRHAGADRRLARLPLEARRRGGRGNVDEAGRGGARHRRSPFLSLVIMGVLPQVMPRFIGFSAYQLDSNLRNSALVGLVGGGGIGATLFTAFQRFDYDFVLTIVLAIIAIVMIGEIVSGWMRRLFQ